MFDKLSPEVKKLIDEGLADIKEMDGKYILRIGGKNTCCRKHWADDSFFEIDKDGNTICKVENESPR